MWRYAANTGNLYRPDGALQAHCYAGGNEGRNPEGVNNPDMQDIKSVGPLPWGPKTDGSNNTYTFGTPVAQSHLGPFAIPLIPDDDNEMFERGDFFMHGDRADQLQSASEGCIIAPRATRNACAASDDNQLEVFLE